LPTPFLKKLLIFAVPALVLAAAWAFLPRMATLPPARLELAIAAPYLIAISGMLLSVHFHRGRVFLALLLVTLYFWCGRNWLLAEMTSFTSRYIFAALAFLLPVNFTLICYMRDKGVFTGAGRMRFAFFAIQAGLVAWLIRYNYDGVLNLLTTRITDHQWLAGLLLPQISMLASLIGGMAITWRMIARQSPVDSALLGTLVAVAVSANGIVDPYTLPLFCSAAALILTLGLIQDSHNMAYRDDLTGLPSRRALNQALLGLGKQYTIAMLDVDHFKRFNDTYGHDVGDQVLKMVAGKMERVTGGGKPFRYGGEEFTIIFPRKKGAQTLSHLEDVRKAIADYQLWLRNSDRPKKSEEGKAKRGGGGSDHSVSVTISIGVAESSDQLRTPHEVIKSADKALYRAKNAGRNRISK